jgi:O-acetyl-ADP-ribose deacetylase (regulator of RNase III)
MKILKGDLLKYAEDGYFDIIIQGCNCFNTFGSGLAKQIKEQYPEAFKADLKTVKGSSEKLGNYTSYDTGKFIIINAYTQYTFSRSKDVFEYGAFSKILDQLFDNFPEDTRFGFPLIGCGLASGNRERIVNMIKGFSMNRDVTIVEYE